MGKKAKLAKPVTKTASETVNTPLSETNSRNIPKRTTQKRNNKHKNLQKSEIKGQKGPNK
jgi:hypothetical protein